MRHKIAGLVATALISALCALSLCSCQSNSTSLQANSKDDSESLPELVIGVDILKPFVYIDHDGTYSGVDADLAVEACKRAGYKAVFKSIPSSDRDSYLQNGDVDCLWTAFVMDGREENYLWTEPYLYSKEAFLAEENAPFNSLEEFNGPIGVAVRANSKAEDLILDSDDPALSSIENVHTYGTFEMAQTAFVKHYADGLIGHRIVLQQVINENPNSYRFLNDNLTTFKLGVAFNKESTDKRNAIDTALKSMSEDGTIAQIASLYDPDGASLEVAPHD